MGIAESTLEGSHNASLDGLDAPRCSRQCTHHPDSGAGGDKILHSLSKPFLVLGVPTASGSSSTALDAPFESESGCESEDCGSVARSPDDVLSELGMKPARALPSRLSASSSTSGIVPSPKHLPSPTTRKAEFVPTPSTCKVFKAEMRAPAAPLSSTCGPNDDETARTALCSTTSSASSSTSSATSLRASPVHSLEGSWSARRHSAPAMPSPQLSPRVNTCAECQSDFTGPSYMLNDHAYCCQRHRLLAYQKLRQDQPTGFGGSASSEADAHALLPTGVRASFRAWM